MGSVSLLRTTESYSHPQPASSGHSPDSLQKSRVCYATSLSTLEFRALGSTPDGVTHTHTPSFAGSMTRPC